MELVTWAWLKVVCVLESWLQFCLDPSVFVFRLPMKDELRSWGKFVTCNKIGKLVRGDDKRARPFDRCRKNDLDRDTPMPNSTHVPNDFRELTCQTRRGHSPYDSCRFESENPYMRWSICITLCNDFKSNCELFHNLIIKMGVLFPRIISYKLFVYDIISLSRLFWPAWTRMTDFFK